MNQEQNRMVRRPFYLDKLIAFGNDSKHKLLVLSGIRGSGKSVLFSLYRSWLADHETPDDHIIFFDLEFGSDFTSTSSPSFFDVIKERIGDKAPVYIFLDEIMVLSDWEKAIAALTFYPVKILIATSCKLSEDFHALFRGQFVDILVFPFSYRERMNIALEDTLPKSDKALSENEMPQTASSIDDMPQTVSSSIVSYAISGGFPQMLKEQGYFTAAAGTVAPSPFLSPEGLLCLRQLFSVAVTKDILERPYPMDYHTLQCILLFLIDHLGELHSPNSIARALSANEETRVIGKPGSKTVAMRTVEKYINQLASAFLIYKVPRYDIKARTMLKTLDKHYFADPGLITALAWTRPGCFDTGSGDTVKLSRQLLDSVLENLVFLELMRRGYDVCTGKIGDRLVDFIVQKGTDKFYIQVTPSMRTPLVRVQELVPLRMIPDNYAKMILTLEPEPDANYDGIRAVSLTEWLVSGAG